MTYFYDENGVFNIENVEMELFQTGRQDYLVRPTINGRQVSPNIFRNKKKRALMMKMCRN